MDIITFIGLIVAGLIVKLAVASAVLFGASSAMAECLAPGLVNGGAGEIGDACCIYNRAGELVNGIVKDAYIKEIQENQGTELEPVMVTVATQEVMKCVLPVRTKVKGPKAKIISTNGNTAIVTTAKCNTATEITDEEVQEEIVTVEAYWDANATASEWQNVISAANNISLVCKMPEVPVE